MNAELSEKILCIMEGFEETNTPHVFGNFAKLMGKKLKESIMFMLKDESFIFLI